VNISDEVLARGQKTQSLVDNLRFAAHNSRDGAYNVVRIAGTNLVEAARLIELQGTVIRMLLGDVVPDRSMASLDREVIRLALFKQLDLKGSLSAPHSDKQLDYEDWDRLGEIADTIISALIDPMRV